jgi:Delta24-sterol reductase
MRTKRSPWLTMSVALRSKDDNHLIDCSSLRDILLIDEERMVARVEPMVDMGTLSAELLPRGLAMQVQIEMEDITVGGLCAGMGMETNSHRVGMIHENVLSLDIVIGDGSLIHATRDNQYADLFTCIPWSHGSLGLLVAVELKLVRIKPFVHVEYICCYTKDSYISKMQQLSNSENAPEYLECTVYSRDTAVIQCGRLADAVSPEDRSKINPVNAFWKTWYYVWMESFLNRKLERYDEFIPAKHYFHRFSRSIFWELRDMIPFANNPIYRYLLGWMGAPKVKIIKLLTNRKIRWETMYKHVVQVKLILELLFFRTRFLKF